jgi:hypothetical protein
MRKIILSLVALTMIISNSFAEIDTFVLSPNGMISTNINEPRYNVYDFPKCSQQSLYEKVLLTIGERFTSPKDVVSKVEGKQISIVCNLSNAVERTKFHSFDMSFTLSFEFKDEKIKVNAPIINSITDTSMKLQVMHICKSVMSANGDEFSIYNGKGKLKNERAKKSLEYSVNIAFLSILESVLDKETNKDW